MSEKPYALRYTWNLEMRKEGYNKEDVENEYHGLCDAMLLVSIIRSPDGSYSQLLLSADGETRKNLTDEDIFKIWTMIGFQLSDEQKLKGWKTQIVDLVSEMIRSHFRKEKVNIHEEVH